MKERNQSASVHLGQNVEQILVHIFSHLPLKASGLLMHQVTSLPHAADVHYSMWVLPVSKLLEMKGPPDHHQRLIQANGMKPRTFLEFFCPSNASMPHLSMTAG